MREFQEFSSRTQTMPPIPSEILHMKSAKEKKH